MERMMKTKRWIGLCLSTALLASLGLCACGQTKHGGEDPIVSAVDYSDIYKYTPVKAAPLQGAVVYKASYGYTLMKEQGYNGFSYRYLSAGAEKNMAASDAGWTGGDASMQDGVMKSGVDSAVRVFTSPVAGTARVYGNPRLLSGTRATVTVRKGTENVVATYEITDRTGVWDDHTLTLRVGDELRFTVEGNAEVYWNPTVDFVRAGEKSLHHAADGYYGDVHPFYDPKSGELYMFYLSTGKQTGQKYELFRTMLTTSPDFIHFGAKDVACSETSRPESTLYFALNVFLDRDDVYRTSVGSNGYASSSKSRDLIIWENGSDFMFDEEGFFYTHRVYFGGGATGGRDPDVFYDKDSDSYYCVVLNYYTERRDNGEKSLAVFHGDRNGKYGADPIAKMDFTGKGDPECPQIKKIGDRWYIFYSVYGTGTAGNVGNFRYRMGGAGQSVDKVNWDAAKEYELDGGDLHASQIFSVGEKYYMYGWINYIANSNVWGGSLNLAREVYQRADGTLATRCDSYLTDLLNMGKIADFGIANTSLKSVTADGSFFRFTGAGTATLSGQYGRSMLTAKVSLADAAKKGGFQISSGSTTIFAGVSVENGIPVLKLGSLTLPMEKIASEYELKLIADGNFIELFVNDEYSLTANTQLTGSYVFGLTADAGAVIQNATVYKLADYENIFD